MSKDKQQKVKDFVAPELLEANESTQTVGQVLSAPEHTQNTPSRSRARFKNNRNIIYFGT